MSTKSNWTEQAHEDTARLRDADLCNVMDAIPAMVWIASPDGKGTHINHAWTEYLGLSLEDTVGFGWTKTVHPDDIDRYLAAWRVSLATGEPLQEEVRYRRAADGEYRWFLSRGIPVRDERGNILKWFGVGTDIEDRKQAEEATRKRENELREVLEQMPAMAFASFPDGSLSYLSRQWMDYSGLSAAETDSHGWERVIHPEDLETYLEQLRVSAATGQAFEHEARFRRATDGEYRWFLVRITPFRDETGKIVKWHGILTDIEDRKRIEEERRLTEGELRQSEFYLAEAQRLSHTGSWAANRNGITYWSDECYRVLGFDPAKGLPPYDWFRRIHPDDQPAFLELLEKVLRDNIDWETDYRVIHPNGRVRNIHATGHSSVGPSGEMISSFGTVVDVTELKQAEEALRRSENELRGVLDLTPLLVAVFGANRERLYASQPTLDYVGLTLQEWKNITDPLWFFHPDDRDRLVKNVYSVSASEVPHDFEARMRRGDGTYRWFLFHDNPLRDEEGRIKQWYLSATDIEDRKAAEEKLRDSEYYLAEAQKLSNTGSWAANTGQPTVRHMTEEWHIRYLSEEWYRVMGFDLKDGMPTFEQFLERMHPDDRPLFFALGAKAVAEKTDWELDYRILHPDGKYRYIHVLGRPVLDSSRDLLEFVGTVIDITERKQAEEALRRSEAYLSEAQKLTKTGSWAWDPRTDKMLYCSDEIYRIFALDSANGIPSIETFMQQIHPDDREGVREQSLHGAREGEQHSIEYRILLPDGTIKHVRSLRRTVVNEVGDAIEVIGTAMDITEHRQAEAALRRSEAYLAEAQKLSHTGSWAYKPGDRKASYYSEEMFRLYGLNPQDGILDRDITYSGIVPQDLAKYRELSAEIIDGTRRAPAETEYSMVVADGSLRHFHAVVNPLLDATGSVLEYIGTVADITQQKGVEQERERLRKLEAELAHMNRVSVMGEMAASLAHEIKQPIAAATTNAQICLWLLEREQLDVSEMHEATSAVVQSVKRAADIIDRVRSLSRKSTQDRELVDVNQVIREIETLLRNESRLSLVTMNLKLSDNVPRVKGDHVQLQQVVMNLMINAIEAMKASGGELVVTSELTDAGRALISVCDSGVGLPEGKQEQIYDAFFTTKSQGTGMGLAISRSIVESHGGRLWAKKNDHRGATFYFELPQYEPEPA